jgi:hypothetical protein
VLCGNGSGGKISLRNKDRWSAFQFEAKVALGILFTKQLSCLCLTGARLDGAEMLACGLATHFVRSNVSSLVTLILTESIIEHPFYICSWTKTTNIAVNFCFQM